MSSFLSISFNLFCLVCLSLYSYLLYTHTHTALCCTVFLLRFSPFIISERRRTSACDVHGMWRSRTRAWIAGCLKMLTRANSALMLSTGFEGNKIWGGGDVRRELVRRNGQPGRTRRIDSWIDQRLEEGEEALNYGGKR